MAISDILSGPIVLWTAPVGETPPVAETAHGAAWGGNWVTYAYTKAPLTANYTFEELDIKVEQELTPLKRRKTSEALMLETVLAELTAARLAVVTSGTATSAAAAAATVGKDELIVGGEYAVDERAWGFEGTYVDSSGVEFPVRIFVWKATAKMNAGQEYSSSDYVGIPIQISALVDTTKAAGQKLWKWQRVTAAATG